ncbi:hypothetical protein BDZ91DRAFT_724578 [Kalaharituber pfeilii]|nr:hypothetical protein BDZ91DRAFT_724578 [Kalaharituber pfeilii]
MPVLRNVSCSVHTALGKLPEYQDKEPVEMDTEIKATRYLDISESVGKAFWIKYKALPELDWSGFQYINVHVNVDGIKIAGASPLSQPYKRSRCEGHLHDKVVNGELKSCVNEMYFSKLNLVEDDQDQDAIRESSKVAAIGKIEVRLYRSSGWIAKASSGSTSLDKHSEAIHQKTMKGRPETHDIQFSASKTLARNALWADYNYIDNRYGTPWATFIFLYRTKESLQYSGILPMPERTAEELKQEIEALKRQLKCEKAGNKRKLEEDHPPSRRQVRILDDVDQGEIEIVDLTDEL